MRKVLGYLNIVLILALFAGIMGSCVKDKFPAEEGTANIIVKLDSHANPSEAQDENALSNEGIKSVRLILVQNGIIVRNKLIEGGKDALLQQGFTISNLKTVPTDFYAIVNVYDKSLETDYKVGSNFNEDSKNKLNIELNKSNGFDFPCVYSEDISLPMYGESLKQPISEGTEISISVTRAVARIDLNIKNTTGEDITITSINFGKFFADKGYLVYSPQSDIYYNLHSDPSKISIPNNDTKSKHFYLFEAIGVDYTEYTLGLIANNTELEKKQIVVNDENLKNNLLKRNTILSINATVSKIGNDETCATIECSVAPWEAIDLGPTFE